MYYSRILDIDGGVTIDQCRTCEECIIDFLYSIENPVTQGLVDAAIEADVCAKPDIEALLTLIECLELDIVTGELEACLELLVAV